MRISIFIITFLFYSTFYAQTNQLLVDISATAENDKAILGFASNAALMRTVGVLGKSDAIDGQGVVGEGRTGVFGQGGDYGVFAVGTFRAGYFSGDLEYTGTLHGAPSDFKLKNFIKNEDKVLPLLLDLKMEKYTYKRDEFETLSLSEGLQFGFVAQNLERYFPHLVHKSVAPARYSSAGDIVIPEVDYKTVNYIGMIPILTQGIQELSSVIQIQERIIHDQKNQIELLEKRVNEIYRILDLPK